MQLTLEQHWFELRRSTYMWIFPSKYTVGFPYPWVWYWPIQPTMGQKRNFWFTVGNPQMRRLDCMNYSVPFYISTWASRVPCGHWGMTTVMFRGVKSYVWFSPESGGSAPLTHSLFKAQLCLSLFKINASSEETRCFRWLLLQRTKRRLSRGWQADVRTQIFSIFILPTVVSFPFMNCLNFYFN